MTNPVISMVAKSTGMKITQPRKKAEKLAMTIKFGAGKVSVSSKVKAI